MAEQDPPQSGNPSGGDETWSTYTPPTSTPAPDAPQASPPPQSIGPTHVPYGSQQSYSGTYPPAPGSIGVSVSSDLVSTTSKGCGGIAAIIGLVTFIPVIIGVIFAIRALSSGFDELDDGLGNPFEGAEKPDMTTAAGFEGMLDALREETGGTTVFEAGLYDGYAVIYTPADKSSKRYYLYYYDGEIRRTSQGTTENTRFDLSTIDASVVVRLLKKAETGLVEDPNSVYLSVRAPKEYDDGAWFHVYASNEFTESGYFTADKTGRTIMEHPPTP
ncbi:MAG: hypothetical protein M3237_07860 [Actinomycetota bacterium]|nr:hypothetical protein [Actinomycetota bacterium]